MPDTLCRKCGGTLTRFSLCAECRDPIQQICTICGTATSQAFHKDCFYHIDSFQINRFNDDNIIPDTSSIFKKFEYNDLQYKNYEILA